MMNKWVLGNSVKVRNEIDDYDYVNKLNKKELNWLNGFHREWANADFKHNYKKIHKTKKHIKSIYDANNRRNRDLHGILSVMGLLYLSNEPFSTCGSENKYLILKNIFNNEMLQDEYYDSKLKEFTLLDYELCKEYIDSIIMANFLEEQFNIKAKIKLTKEEKKNLRKSIEKPKKDTNKVVKKDIKPIKLKGNIIIVNYMKK